MKFRRHHNNKGYRQIKNGKTYEQVKHLAKKYGIFKNRGTHLSPYWRENLTFAASSGNYTAYRWNGVIIGLDKNNSSSLQVTNNIRILSHILRKSYYGLSK